ncbi:hypothetical protein INT45_004609 [Circinella minor]|uniref:NADH dehydrogenase [ubiquinone] 1 beta subcomplex subunit 11, mitochondrial n=1 Tax=Circinella minor TaxID=1195481 RepID=A0A8H7S1L6_9FUNG|nr:hypothetical protein INT45_004609 [Circinella minor]KAI7851212.1 hypothetical protein BDC45DRAFT_572297 [Circinella umbellata]
MLARVLSRSSRLTTRSTLMRRGGGGNQSWNEPGGYLFGEKNRVKEEWESIYYWGMGGGCALMAAALYYKPDTSVTTWATKEAEKQLKEKGIKLDFEKTV